MLLRTLFAILTLALGPGAFAQGTPQVDAGPAAVTHYNAGVASYQMGRYNDAADQFRAAIHLDPEFAEAHANLGLVLEGSDRDAAIRQLRAATALKPDMAEAHNTLGALLYRQGQFAAAAAEYRTVLRLHPDSVAGHYNLGLALSKMGHPQAAIAEWEQTVRLKPDFTDARLDLGQALYLAGRHDDARAQWRVVAGSGHAADARSARRLLTLYP